MSNGDVGYRSSHASPGYGQHYEITYTRGYYAQLWQQIEQPLVEDLFGRLARMGCRSCLDFACGTGRITVVAERYFEQCVGVDVSEPMLEIARRKCARAQLLGRDTTSYPLSCRFDVITAFRFFLNAEPQLRAAALVAMKSMLVRNGRLVINVHVNKTSPLGVIYRLRNRILQRQVANTLGRAELEDLLRRNGFRIDEVLTYGLFPRMGWYFDWLSRALMMPVERLFQSVSLIPRALAQSFIVVCSANESTHDQPQR